MSHERSLIPIGSDVRVRLDRVRDRIPKDLIVFLGSDPIVKVKDYKMTDMNSIGVIVQLRNGIQTWFFDNEVENLIDVEDSDSLELTEQSSSSNLLIYDYINSSSDESSIAFLLNPFNFINWLLYSMKDIF